MPIPNSRQGASLKSKHSSPQAASSTKKLTLPYARARVSAVVGDENDAEDAAEPAEEEEANNEESEEQKDGEQAEDTPAEPAADVPAEAPETKKKKKKPKPHPQEALKNTWKKFEPEYLGRITKVLPEPVPTADKPKTQPVQSLNSAESYKAAREQCLKTVELIVAECHAVNQKYSDIHFDLERDLKVTRNRDCIDGLVQDDDDRDSPSDVKRVTDIFDDPKFFADGAGFDDIVQGATGDCWMMSAFSVLSCSEELLRKVCVFQDQEVGVYGFVFFRDGEWFPTVIDDKLYLSSEAFDEGVNNMLAGWGKDQEQKYNELFQRGSRALYFAKCRDENETWVPLLEKALAKAHGGYDAVRGGQTGEAIEDLTGGITTEIYTTNILSKEKFWTNDLRKIGKDFMFDATDAMYREWQGWNEDVAYVERIRKERRKGVVQRHAYAVLDTYEGHGERLVKVRNPWGEQEWDGAWSDGSSQWTATWLERLGHKFGDDGVFWMSYKDFLSHFKHIDRTRIFDDSWFTAQKWANFQIPFSTLDYQATKFTIDVPEDTPAVIVLSQLDDRYFRGLEGQYAYRLQFRVSHADKENEYIGRSRQNYELTRSTNIEIDLKAGKYIVLIKIEAIDYGRDSPEEVIKANLPDRKEKVITIGRLYDLAHQKGLPDPAEEDQSPATTSEDPAKDETTETKPTASSSNETKTQPEKEPSASANPLPFPVPLPVQIITTPPEESDDDEDEEEEEEKEPWNAHCVAGLRVYSKLQNLTVGVVWPPKPVSTEAGKEVVLDRDDITKAAEEKAEEEAEDDDEEEEEEESTEEE